MEQGAAKPKYTIFHTELEFWSVACGATPTGWGTGALSPEDGTGRGWAAWGPWQGGRGSFPATFQRGAAAAALPSHPGEGALHRRRGGSAGATFTSHPSLPARSTTDTQTGLARQDAPQQPPHTCREELSECVPSTVTRDVELPGHRGTGAAGIPEA